MTIPFIVEAVGAWPDHQREYVESLIELAYLEGKPLVLPSGWRVGAFLSDGTGSRVSAASELSEVETPCVTTLLYEAGAITQEGSR